MSKKFRNFRVKYQESSIEFENLAYLQSTENKCKWALIWVIAELCTVFQTRVITKKKTNWENLMNFVAVAIVSAIVLGHPFNKRVVFWLV